MWDNYCVLTNLSSQPEFETYQYQTALLLHSIGPHLMVSESSNDMQLSNDTDSKKCGVNCHP